MLIEFTCLNGHTWEVWFDGDELCWSLKDLNPDWVPWSAEPVEQAGLSEYDQQRAEETVSLATLDDRMAA